MKEKRKDFQFLVVKKSERLQRKCCGTKVWKESCRKLRLLKISNFIRGSTEAKILWNLLSLEFI